VKHGLYFISKGVSGQIYIALHFNIVTPGLNTRVSSAKRIAFIGFELGSHL